MGFNVDRLAVTGITAISWKSMEKQTQRVPDTDSLETVLCFGLWGQVGHPMANLVCGFEVGPTGDPIDGGIERGGSCSATIEQLNQRERERERGHV